MAEKYLSTIWSRVAPGLGNHLWQSTLVAVVAALLALALRKHHARARYWLWLAASMKFLIPFSLLIGIGSRLAWQHQSAEAARPTLYFAMEEIGQPFTQAARHITSAQASTTVSPALTRLLPWLAAVWFIGFLVVLLVWVVRWRRISQAMKAATPLHEGREVGTLRRMERAGGIHKPIGLLLSRASLEPGIFGIARPVLIWPEGISLQLQDAHLEAILAHEVWHVRRRDNLAAAFHMLVEAVFWFYPLVWWLGARLIEERERACDEEVLALGSDRQAYAESILKVCEFCLGSPLPCVSGVTGADLKKRMVRIMNDRIFYKLDFTRKLMLGSAAVLAIALPVTFGVFHATPGHAQAQAQNAAASAPAYQAVSIKPHSGNGGFDILFNSGGFAASNVTLQAVIRLAYGVEDDRISGAPAWVNSEKYDIGAKLSTEAPEDIGGIGIQQLRLMLQALLADRFKLSLHRETKDLPVYALVIAENGPKLQVAKAGGPGNMKMGSGELTAQGTSLTPLLEQLSQRLGRTVLDKTGLTGNYDFVLRWTPGESESPMFKAAEGGQQPPAPESSEPSITTLLQQQLGLKLEQQTVPMEILVIDHVEKPNTESTGR